ncbi:MAG: hypothetical protein H7196_01180, partial [candidate division SR1 bacterium]|nr:hypothetical protein [candidate division SR1 bacterium]
SQVNINGAESANISTGPTGIDTKLNADISSDKTYQPKKGMFQPRNPNAQIPLSR